MCRMSSPVSSRSPNPSRAWHSPALDAVSGEIRKGVITGLVGPDGAGKTTLLRIIAGLLVPSSGSVATLGLDPVTEAAAIHLELGYMPQKFGLYEDLTVIENLTLHADLRNVTGREREETFERSACVHRSQAFHRALRRQALRRHETEARSGLRAAREAASCSCSTSPASAWIRFPAGNSGAWSDKLVDDGIAVVWSTAYLDEAELCGTALLLHEGKLVFSGAPATLTAPLAGRCWHLKNPAGNKRRLLARALSRPEVGDGTIQGRHLRLTFREGAQDIFRLRKSEPPPRPNGLR